MSLQEIYDAQFGDGAAGYGAYEGAEKTAEEHQMDGLLGNFDEVELDKLAAAGELLDAFGIEFEDGPEKLASACNLVDFLSEDDGEGGDYDAEKLAEEYDAAGRIMAHGLVDELSGGEEYGADSLRARLG